MASGIYQEDGSFIDRTEELNQVGVETPVPLNLNSACGRAEAEMQVAMQVQVEETI